MLTQGGYHESRLEAAMPFLLFAVPGLLVTCRIAWVLHLPASAESRGRPLLLTILFSVGGAFLGAVLISQLLWRQYWVRLFWQR
jgi:prolipoprotein diacylglyceryltransferase